jgi:hypothetical protein
MQVVALLDLSVSGLIRITARGHGGAALTDIKSQSSPERLWWA